jgi:hypothetical protein
VAMPNSSTAKHSAKDYEECLNLQQEALSSFKPDVIVGSSFGGGICLDLIGRGHWEGPAVIMCHAFQLAKPDTPVPQLVPGVPYCLVHGTRDAVVPPEHSAALLDQTVIRNAGIDGSKRMARLVQPDDTHGLRTVCGLPAKEPGSLPLPPHCLLDQLVWDVWEAANVPMGLVPDVAHGSDSSSTYSAHVGRLGGVQRRKSKTSDSSSTDDSSSSMDWVTFYHNHPYTGEFENADTEEEAAFILDQIRRDYKRLGGDISEE